MGVIMFEVGFVFACVVIYFVIGNYYRTSYGFLLAVISFFLYLVGLGLQFGLFARFFLQALPFAIIIYRHSAGNVTIEKGKKMCPVCGFLNDQNTDICKAPHCEAVFTDNEDTSKLSFYLPPKFVVGIVVFIAGGSLLYEYTAAGKFAVSVIYGAWPAVAALCFLLFILYKLL